MDILIGILCGFAGGAVGGYLLATHMHSIAAAASADVVKAVTSVVGATPAAAAPPAPAKV
jgi:uncharacterized membrane protein YeaQ/YmgE (transglycosylase-associated protein family)